MTDVTREVVQYALGSRWADLPPVVQHEARRLFLNWVGCAIGGSSHPAVAAAHAALGEIAGPPQATVLGLGTRTDIAHAALLNGLSASAHAFDDTHLPTVAHPTAPAAAALLALAERAPVSGAAFLHALILANELQCRLSNALVVAPAHCHVGFYMSGITGAFGVAAGAGRLIGLDPQQMIWALGIGAAQASGFRATHASMSSGFVPGHAARCGLVAALMASRGFTCSEHFLEGRNGFADVFGAPAHLAALTDRLGEHFECMAVACKPYPAGVFIHPVIEACLALRAQAGVEPETIQHVALRVHPLALGLTGKPEPRHAYDAQVSVYHWAAAALVRNAAGLREASDASVGDGAIVAMRRCINASEDASLRGDEAHATATLRDGTTRHVHVDHCLGSAARPLTDGDLEAKFLAQVADVVPLATAKRLIDACWNLPAAADVSRVAPGIWGR